MVTIIEEYLKKVSEKEKDLPFKEVEDVFYNILNSAIMVQEKMHILQAKDLINNHRIEELKGNEIAAEHAHEHAEEKSNLLMNLGSKESLTTLTDLMLDAQMYFQLCGDCNRKGYMMTYKQYQALQFLQVNYHILAHEFNEIKKKNKELIQFKFDYAENKDKWDRKVQASAGDV